MKGDFVVNGVSAAWEFRPEALLLDVLRANGSVDVKEGCRSGECGACTVLLDGRPVNACRVLAATVAGKKITTVRGIGDIHDPHPIQRAFVDAGAVQCGFCTPGMVLSAYALLEEEPRPDEGQIRRALDGNLCRCTGYVKIVEAVRLASERMAAHE